MTCDRCSDPKRCNHMSCEKCGEPHERCNGHVKNGPRKGKQCMRQPKGLQPVCGAHGANQRTKSAAMVREVEHEANEVVAKRLADRDIEPLDDPVGALLEIAGEARVLHDVLRERLNLLEERWTHRDFQGKEEMRAYVAAYERSLERVFKFGTDLEKLGLETRRVELEEARWRPVFEAVVETAGQFMPEGDVAEFKGLLRERLIAMRERGT